MKTLSAVLTKHLQTRCGSAWGGWRVWYTPQVDTYTVARCKEGTTRVVLTSNRECYNRQPDDTFIPKEKLICKPG